MSVIGIKKVVSGEIVLFSKTFENHEAANAYLDEHDMSSNIVLPSGGRDYQFVILESREGSIEDFVKSFEK